MTVINATAKKAILTSIFVSTLAFSGAVSAKDNGVALVLSNMMKNVLTQTAQEMDLQLQKSIIELGHNIELGNSDFDLPATSVSITDLASLETEEKLNLSEEAND